MRRPAFLVAVVGLGACAVASSPDGSPDPTVATASHALGSASHALAGTDPDEVLGLYVVLEGQPAAELIQTQLSHDQNVARTRQRVRELGAQHAQLRPLLIAHHAHIVGEFTRLANAIQVLAPRRSLPELRGLPHVVDVVEVPIVQRSLLSAVPLVGAPAVWAADSPYRGQGVTIGILDTGIDYLHADFGGSGDPDDYTGDDHTIIEPGSFPTLRVVGGWDLSGDDYNADDPNNSSPAPDPDPIDCGGHGTHVAGIAAGNGVLNDTTPFMGPYTQSLDRSQFFVGPGVAPEATLYAIKVFGCNGSTGLVGLGLERAADPNQDSDFSDRLDVVNASLGSPYGVSNPVNELLIKNYTALGGLFVVAAGNDGNNFFITGAPGNANEGLSVAASFDRDFLAMTVQSPPSVAGDYAAVEGAFTVPLVQTGAISGQLVYADPPHACDQLDNGGALVGKIALIDRGGCLFADKLANAEAAGAMAVVMVQSVSTDLPFSMGGSGNSSNIVGVMIGRDDGDSLKPRLAEGVVVTLDAGSRLDGSATEVLAGFSSRGPSATTLTMKPEVAAPGVSIDSAGVGTGFGARRLQGTSMATPIVAGAAALLRQAKPTLSPEQIKALLINTTSVVKDAAGETYPLSMQGGGRINVDRALARNVTAAVSGDDGLVALSFGSIVAYKRTRQTLQVVVRNHGSEAVSYQAAISHVQPLNGVSVSVDPSSFSVEPDGTKTIDVTMSLDPRELGEPQIDPVTSKNQFDTPRHYLHEAAGHLRLDDDDGAQSLTLPFYASVRAGSNRRAGGAFACGPPTGAQSPGAQSPGAQSPGDGTHWHLPMLGPSAHPEPVVTAFELGYHDTQGSEPSDAGDQSDVLVVGATTNLVAVGAFEQSTLFFAVGVAGPWSSPALGQLPAVGVEIDLDGDDVPEYRINPEPYEADGPFGDVLVAMAYDLVQGSRVATRRFLNIANAAEAPTHPYFSSVLVLPAFAKDIGLTADASTFQYRAYTTSLLASVAADVSDWVAYDAARPKVDFTAGAATKGRPLYRGDQPVLLTLVDATPPPPILLLHHSNVGDSRFEIVELAAAEPEEARISFEFPDDAQAGELAIATLTIENRSSHAIRRAELSGSVGGARVELLAPGRGVVGCKAAVGTGAFECEIDRLEPGGQAVLSLQLFADGLDPVALDAELISDIGCVTTSDGNMSVTEAGAPSPSYDGDGGCGCRIVASPPRATAWAWLLALAAAACVRRRR
jgi:subtilisin family serine protease